MQEKLKNFSHLKRSKVRNIIITDEESGQRIDNFIQRFLPSVPKNRIYNIIRRGEVRINGGRVGPSYKLLCNDKLRLPPVYENKNVLTKKSIKKNWVVNTIIFEDKNILVLNKPSGIAVHGGSGINYGVIECVREVRADLRKASLAHRLDRETSGCLILSKKRSALRYLHEKFRSGLIEKNYFALVLGHWELGEKLFDFPLLVSYRKGKERHVIVDKKNGKPSKTIFRLIKSNKKYSLLNCQPLTGRTHQIRVHLSHLGYPILGDEKYGNFNENKKLRKLGLKRLFLHAQSIAFKDHNDNEKHFTASLSSDLDNFIDKIFSE